MTYKGRRHSRLNALPPHSQLPKWPMTMTQLFPWAARESSKALPEASMRIRFNMPERQTTFARIATLLGAKTSSLDEQDAAEQAIRAVEQLKRDIGIPQRIRDIGGHESQLAHFAEKSFAIKRLLWVNPRRATQEDLLGILRAAY